MQTRSQSELQQLQESVAALSALVQDLRTTMDERHDSTVAAISALQRRSSSPPPSLMVPSSPPLPSEVAPEVEPLPSPPKIHLQLFDGSNPLDWLFHADQFFAYYAVPPKLRLRRISCYMSGDALAWFQWMHNNGLLSTWQEFVSALELRFGPSSYENHRQALFKLRQSGSIVDYQREFEQLCNRVVGLSPETVLDCFLSGLLPEFQREMAIFQPRSISQAIGLAKLLESKFNDRPFLGRAIPAPSPLSRTAAPVLTAPVSAAPRSAPPVFPARPALPIKRLSPAKMQARRAKGLCFNCDEKFYSGHRCRPKQFLLLLADEDAPPASSVSLDCLDDDCSSPLASDTPPPLPVSLLSSSSPIPSHFHLSIDAVSGMQSPRTLRLTVYIQGRPVSVLVDSGSSHNILQPRIAQLLDLKVHLIVPFSVLVGNGASIGCSGVCSDVPIQLQQHAFRISFYLLPVHGADVILGVQWLRTLGPFVSDFSIPSMQFYYDGSLVVLVCVASVHAVSMLPVEDATRFPLTSLALDVSADLAALLQRYAAVFALPRGLPPPRAHDHRIHLVPNAHPVASRPYRYPHFQRKVMATLISEMLRDGLIRPSTSPYSSPVLLVRKKDGSWRFCTDYRALNAITVKDRFSIPAIDELLDELHGAAYFSKLDLRSGYHQIRMCPEDITKTAFRSVDGHYEFVVMPFGLTNAPSIFQSAMNDLFRPNLRR
ncbi:uncharacterized protein LOC105162605 [Sesamum indicum]|uniref:Uncharacterized protein LOC105162605 n=1 Tax=Sesamum indicum TaxID=4182 RepID=A0A6I9T715_SESIN|nr:uncharacterized protein LOC105162605 [Sesamum indicum]